MLGKQIPNSIFAFLTIYSVGFTQEANFAPDPLAVPSETSNSDLRISEQKCAEYSKAVTSTIMVLPLLTNTEPISFDVEKCDYNSVALIIGGEPASEREFPFMAALGFDTDDQKWRCGATLISDRYVVTAAHCAYASDAGSPIVIRVGDLDLSNDDEFSKHRDYEVAEVIVHPDYKYPLKYNDIALIQTKEEITFTEFIRPACLYTKDYNIPVKFAVATGWGRTDFSGEYSNRLMKVTLNIYGNDKCAKAYHRGRALPKGVLPSMLCAGELRGGKDTCLGDSGGPLLVTAVGNQCKFYVIGITSFGRSCGQVNVPAIYTKVSSYIDWIERTIW